MKVSELIARLLTEPPDHKVVITTINGDYEIGEIECVENDPSDGNVVFLFGDACVPWPSDAG